MSVIGSNILAGASGGAGGPDETRSVRFNEPDSAYLSRSPSGGNRKRWSLSFWYKPALQDTSDRRCIIEARNASAHHSVINFRTDNKFEIYHYDGSGLQFQVLTTAVFRDPSAWYSFVIAYNTEASGSDKIKIFCNGERITAFDTANYPADNYEALWNDNGVSHTIGKHDTQYLSGYLAQLYWIDGSQLDATSFGAYDSNNVWQLADYTGSYPGQSYHLFDFENESTLGHDSSGNNNDWTANNLSTTAGAGNDVLLDYPVNGSATDQGNGGEVSGNYATLNAVAPHGLTLRNGNLDGSGSVIQGHAPSTIFASSGKFYCEFTLTTYQADTGVGVAASIADPGEDWIGEQAYMIGYLADGRIFQNSSATNYSSYAANDVIGVAFDADTGKVWFSKNGTYQNSGDPAAGTGQVGTITGGYALGFTFRSVGGAGSFNFGARSFAYSAPSGFKALCTTNLPTPTIADGSDHFDTSLWTGNGTTQSITGLGFSPDLVWYKCRSSASNLHGLFDTVRGASKQLYSNNTNAEATYSGVSAFNSDGFDLGSDNGGNQSSETYVGWAWDAGTSTVSNTDGSITSQVRASQSSGFSIVEYTGNATNSSVGHGLNAPVKLILIKSREVSSGWAVYHDAIGTSSSNYIELQSLNAAAQDNTAFQNTAPTSSVFSIGTKAAVNNDEDSHIAYCFAPVAGYSAISEYSGSGSSGNFIYLGFRPAFIMIKSTSAYGWAIIDSTRSSYNTQVATLYPNKADAEFTGSGHEVDFLSNGFNLRNSNDRFNRSSTDYLYYAVAENPFQANGGLAR